MEKIRKIQVTSGVYWVEVPDARSYVLCGCPADSIKHLMRRGLIVTTEKNGVTFETGPNAILLSDVLVQNGGFANLSEFPVLQMLYRQGMILPNHPNNTGEKPMLIGSKEQVNAQMQYIYRGNYGLISEEEIINAGVSQKTAHEIMRLKIKFAFGNIRKTEELLDARIVENEPIEIRNNVFIRRLGLNVFQFQYEGEQVTVNLNLASNESYGASYTLGFYNIKREYFGVIHSGEADGWDVDRPTMSSILMFQGKIYLIDAGPNMLYSLMSLGISVNEIEGIFHTHSHDDHFCGLPALMQADHKIKYYATPLVRASIAKKMSALLSIDEEELHSYFEIHDLEFDTWNNIGGLGVRPMFSPHPVETNIFIFRVTREDGYASYAHFADIVSLDVLEGMITENDTEIGISREFFDKVKKEYLSSSHLKKLDIGGGLIHGKATDFRKDPSKKLILAHTSLKLTSQQKEIGSGAPFGMTDILIPAVQNYTFRSAFQFLQTYFPTAPPYHMNMLLNNALVTFNPDSILIKGGIPNTEIYLILTGNVEMIQSESDVNSILSAGALIGEISGLTRSPSKETYRAVNFVQALRLPARQYLDFVIENGIFSDIELLQDKREFLQKTRLFGEAISYPIQNKLARAMQFKDYAAGQVLPKDTKPLICLTKRGKLERYIGENIVETLVEGDFFGEETVLFGTSSLFKFRAVEPTVIYEIDADMVRDIPVVRWKLFETHEKRKKL